MDPVRLIESNQKAEGNLCDFRAISWEVEELEVDRAWKDCKES